MSAGTLQRRLGLADAVAIGLGSMIGAGIFAVFAPAAAAAGAWLPAGLALAALVAFCNATSSAQLSAQYPASGGTYHFGRERLGPWPGFLAGWCFVIGKSASCAAMAMTFAAYVAPGAWQRPVAALAVAVLVAVTCRGVTRTARLTMILVAVVLAVLLAVIVTAAGSVLSGELVPPGDDAAPSGPLGILQSAGLLFFAFAGYARIATMGEEVRSPARTVPRAIIVALSVALALYAVLAVLSLLVMGADTLASSSAPLADLVRLSGWEAGDVVVRAGAAAATLGALLAALTGIGRTGLAMARNADLPTWLAAVHPRHGVPHRAQLIVGVVVVLVVLSADLRGAIGFSSFGVLLYYLVANLSALTQDQEHRRYPRTLQALGAVLCLLLVVTLPPASILGGLVVVAAGVTYRMVLSRRGHAAE